MPPQRPHAYQARALLLSYVAFLKLGTIKVFNSVNRMWFNIGVATAMIVETISTLLWLRLRKEIKPGIWWAVLAALLLVILHCAAYWTDYAVLAEATALSNSLLVLMVVIVARRGVYKTKQLEQQVVAQKVTIETERSLAHQLAEVLNDYKTKLEYYEALAKQHNLSLAPMPPSSPESTSASAA